jgi:hypothetical protein
MVEVNRKDGKVKSKSEGKVEGKVEGKKVHWTACQKVKLAL